MSIPFRDYHLLTFLKEYEKSHGPLDLALHHYFRSHKSLGSKDRAAIASTLFPLIRWKGLLDHLCQGTVSWEKRLNTYRSIDVREYQNDPAIPTHIQVSFPKVLFNRICSCYGAERASDVCLMSNLEAPLTVRANPCKISCQELLKRWQPHYDVTACHLAPHGIRFKKRCSLFQLEEFKEGLFEVQDEGSQLLAELVGANPGDQVLDYCAGSGGKTLALAPRMRATGQIYLHDIRPPILAEAKRRLKRAGVEHAQIVLPNDKEKLKKLKKKMDWVLVDVPCSGSGTLRRNPDMKWRYSELMLQQLIGKQRHIFEQGLSFLKEGGKIVYATCSLLQEENQQQVEHFCRSYNMQQCDQPFQSLPSEEGMDGFFGAILMKKN